MSPYFLYQAIRYRKYIGSLRQRLGYLPISFNVDGEESIWIHAVSVGEALTARALAADLKARYPRLRLFLSTTTIAGQQVARRNLQHVDAVFYFPFDWAFIVRRTLNIVKPRVFVMMETEIWPNLLRECRARGVQDRRDQRPHLVAVVSALPAGPAVLPPRARRRRSLLHAERGVGAAAHRSRRRPARVTVTGSLKFDSLRAAAAPSRTAGRASACCAFSASAADADGDRRRQHDARRGDGRAARLRAHQGDCRPARCAILAPRQPERFARGRARSRATTAFVTARRSELPIDAEPRADVVVLDTIGELAQVYQLATVVFVGGSLVDHGGHNILEPAVFGKPIVFGPHMQNFKEIADAFLHEQRGRAGALGARARGGAADARDRSGAPRAARRRRARAGRGESRRQAEDARCHRGAAATRWLRRAWCGPSGWCIDPRAQLGLRRRRRRGAGAGMRRDPRVGAIWSQPVVSIGNLRVGGTGKTPAVACIARILLEAGERPSILTRGYARRAPSRRRHGRRPTAQAIVATADASGDEPMLLARALPGVPVLVGADRYLSGRLAEERFGATVHLLDDGFQHLELARDVDLLVVSEDDLTDAPLPAGRLREPLDAAAAADAALVSAGYATAAERVGRVLGVEVAFRVTRALGAPRTIAPQRDTVVVPAGARVFVAAGIARPERFVADVIVGRMGGGRDGAVPRSSPVSRTRTSTGSPTPRVAARAAIVLTTEKDAMRFESCDLGDIPLASVPLIAAIEPADAFRDWLLAPPARLARFEHPPAASGTLHPAPSTRHPAPGPSTRHPL